MCSAGDSVAFLLLTQSTVCPLCHRGTMQRESPCPGRNPTHVPGHFQVWGTALARTRRGCPRVCPNQSQTRLSIPSPKQELGSQEEIWLKAFRGLCWLCPARADSFFQGKVLHHHPVMHAGVQSSSIPHPHQLQAHWGDCRRPPGRKASLPALAPLPGHPSWQARLGDHRDGWRLRSGRQ